jgi:hypothetical protein
MILAVACLAPSAAAQSPLKSGDRVRLTKDSVSAVFTIVEVLADTLVVSDAKRPVQHRLAKDGLSTIEISRGRQTSGARVMRGAGIGALVGIGTGALVGLMGGEDEGDFFFSSPEERAAALGLVFGTVGVVVGGIVGLATPEERWERVSLPAGLAVMPRGRGLTLSYSRTF